MRKLIFAVLSGLLMVCFTGLSEEEFPTLEKDSGKDTVPQKTVSEIFRRYHRSQEIVAPDVNKSVSFFKMPAFAEAIAGEFSFVEVLEAYVRYAKEYDSLERDFRIRIIGLPYVKEEIHEKDVFMYTGKPQPFVILIRFMFLEYFELSHVTMPRLDYEIYYKENEVVVKILNGLGIKNVKEYKQKAVAGFYSYKDFLSPGDNLYYENDDKSVIIYGRR